MQDTIIIRLNKERDAMAEDGKAAETAAGRKDGAMEIRVLKKGDMPALAVLYRAFWDEPSDVPAMERQLEAMQAEGNAVVLGALAGGELLGSVTGYFCRASAAAFWQSWNAAPGKPAAPRCCW